MCVHTVSDAGNSHHLFISGGSDGQVVFWDTRLGQHCHKVHKQTNHCVNSACTDPTGEHLSVTSVEKLDKLLKGRLLIMTGETGDCDLFDIRGNRLLQSLRLHDGEVIVTIMMIMMIMMILCAIRGFLQLPIVLFKVLSVL